jgi:hypothetical protein
VSTRSIFTVAADETPIRTQKNKRLRFMAARWWFGIRW